MKRVKKIVRYQCESTKKWHGEDITVVVMDTGMALHPALLGRGLLFHDFVNDGPEFYDDNGHGTHVCGVIAGKNFGIAPACNLIVLKVLDETGNGDIMHSLRGIRWILENQEKYNIRVVNISMGMKPGSNKVGELRIMRSVELLWDMGLVVIAAAGNLGPKEGTITIPGLHKKIITVGSSEDRFYTDELGRQRKSYSGRGSVKAQILKPDLVAPGSDIVSCNYQFGEGKLYARKSGTSMATPVVSGAAALLLSKHPNLTNYEVKERLKLCCTDLGMPRIRQGSGLLNVERLLETTQMK